MHGVLHLASTDKYLYSQLEVLALTATLGAPVCHITACQIRSKRATKDSETDVFVEIFDELQKGLESAPAANPPAADTARLEGVPLTSSGRTGLSRGQSESGDQPSAIEQLQSEMVQLPFQVRSKRGTKASDTDVVVEIIDELQQALRSQSAASAGSQPPQDVPHFFQPYQQKMRMSTREGRASVIVSMQPKGNISLAFAADKMREVWGGEWPVAYLAYAQGYLHMRGTGVRRVDDLEIALSRDGEQWVVASPEAHQKQALWEGLLLRRRKDEGKSGRPWADGLWSHQLEE